MSKYILAIVLFYLLTSVSFAQQWIPSYCHNPYVTTNSLYAVGPAYAYSYVYPYQYQYPVYLYYNPATTYTYGSQLINYDDRYINRRVWIPNIHRYYQNHNHYYNYRYFYNY